MDKQEILSQHLRKVTDPKSWKEEFKEQVMELLEGIAELYIIDKSLETLIGSGKRITDFQDPEIRERMKIVIVGGLLSSQGQKIGRRPIAPVLWELFNIQLYPYKGVIPLNQEGLMDYLKHYGIENIVIRKEKSRWFNTFSGFYWVIDSLLRFLEIIGETSFKGNVSLLVKEYQHKFIRIDKQQAETIFKYYIPLPSQRAEALEVLLNKIMNALRNLAPGVNPYITFSLSVDTVIAQDLLDLINNQEGFKELVKMLDYVALEDSRGNGNIIYRMPYVAEKDVTLTPRETIFVQIKNSLNSSLDALRRILLYMVVIEESYGRPGRYEYGMNWVHKFCCYVYNVGCIEGKGRQLGEAYRFEKLIFGTDDLMNHICSYMLSEIRRIYNTAKTKAYDVRNLLKELLRNRNGSIDIFKARLLNLSVSEYIKYWDKVYAIRNAGILYSPAFALCPLITPRKLFPETRIKLMLNAPYFCDVRREA